MGTSFLFAACEKNNPSPVELEKGNIAIYVRVPNPGGQTGTGWLQLMDDNFPQTVSNQNAFQVGYSAPMATYNNDIFTFPDFGDGGTTNALIKWSRENGKLIKSGELPLPAYSLASNIGFVNSTKAYLGTWLGKLIIFNPQTMQKTGEIDMSSYAAEGIPVPYFGGLFVHNDKLYASLMQVTTSFMPATAPSVEIAIIDTKTDQVEKVITEKESGISIGTYNYGQSTFADENGDIYFLCSGLLGMDPNHKTGILRIKKGESEFDPTYKWILNDQVIEGETGNTRWLEIGLYNGNGKVFATMDMPKYWADPDKPNWFNDKSVISVEMDIYVKTVKKLNIPNSASYAPVIEKYEGNILFGVYGVSQSGYYLHNPKTGETSSEPVIKTTGYPVGFHYFGK